jgi:hypothetical protein
MSNFLFWPSNFFSAFFILNLKWAITKWGTELTSAAGDTNVRYADDVAIFAHTARNLQMMLRDLNTKSKEVGLSLNPTNTKIATNHTEIPLTIEGTKIEHCKEYPYLGQNISMAGEGEIETQRRIRHAWG